MSNLKQRLEKLDSLSANEDIGRKLYSIDEDRWITIKGTHVLTDDAGNIKNEKIKKKLEDSRQKKVLKQKEAIKKSVSDLPEADNFDSSKNSGNIKKISSKLKDSGMEEGDVKKVTGALSKLNKEMENFYDMADSGRFDEFDPEDVQNEINSCKDRMKRAGLDNDSINKILNHTGMDDFYM